MTLRIKGIRGTGTSIHISLSLEDSKRIRFGALQAIRSSIDQAAAPCIP